jgi:hypothetical protein
MAKVERPLYGDTATGEIAGTLAFKKGDRFPRLEIKRVPSKSRTLAQQSQRQRFYDGRSAWLSLSEAEQGEWNGDAPAGMTGYQFYLQAFLAPLPWALGALIIGQDIINQGNPPITVTESQYVLGFPGTADSFPGLTDGIDGTWDFEINKIFESLEIIEAYLLEHKNSIEG